MSPGRAVATVVGVVALGASVAANWPDGCDGVVGISFADCVARYEYDGAVFEEYPLERAVPERALGRVVTAQDGDCPGTVRTDSCGRAERLDAPPGRSTLRLVRGLDGIAVLEEQAFPGVLVPWVGTRPVMSERVQDFLSDYTRTPIKDRWVVRPPAP